VVNANDRRTRASGRSALRGRERTERSAGPVNICRLRVPLPGSAWIAEFSSQHPEVRIEVLSRLDIGHQRSLTELRLHAPDPHSLVEELRGLPQVEMADELEGTPSEVHLRVVNRTSEFISIFRDLQVMRRFPFTIEAGVGNWVVVAPQTKIQRLMARLRERVPTATVEAVRHADPARPTGPLTPRQADLLRRAMAAGYFEVPRKVTLTALARNLGMAPSSLSESLAIVEKKLLERWPAPA
jgi:predicted DNA binding protein